ncbi:MULTISPECIES: distal tail protein Dit [Staphylococcus]|uniref:distal tail protein Dit n=1 Tax=Staphylococcus TaxID=1279 RepID=UPI000763E8CA|nr:MULTISPECIES: distal tail protein Dit [Staphylococcus]KXA43062.1 phage tail component protein [Staphylococcus simulans]OFM20096.1 phage tail protein [Staphylococcus sp. HMSC059E03]OFN21599.1 phage tail protein [Staphylococcus sp. HMSC055C03]OHR53406.1 phage tail protein [Staphylococcus sp. HMSC070A03]OHR55535.1 phage tail protein [Staphylococcus sp. HMSC070A02]
MKKEARIFNNNIDYTITDIPNLKFLDFEEEGVEVQANTLEINGTDGVLLGPTTFGPFNLVLNFSFKGEDKEDLRLLKQKLRTLFYRREPYYIWHSDMPGKKYAVYCESTENEDLTNSFATFKVTFVVYKGFSESLDDTSQFSLNNGRWQFESGVLATKDVHYRHDHTAFRIYNGSSDTINPIMHHFLKIVIHADAPNGLKIRNETTDDEFEYKEPLNYANNLTINGVHPFLDHKERVGKYTNFEWLTLAPGYNQIVITGQHLKRVQTEWIFNFIYR